MQILIDIPEEDYQLMKDGHIPFNILDKMMNGVPLPKGHGDLIDRKELLKQPMDTANYPSNYVKIAPPIIEADKESEE